jgi:glycosyltransferase involved in cell wall biosynthesis
MVRAVDRARYEPIVLVPHDGPMVALYREAGARVLFTPMMQLRTKPSPVYQANYLARYVPTVRRLARIIDANAIELVHSNSLYCSYGAWAARRTRRQHIWHLRELPPRVPLATRAYASMVRRLSTRIVGMTRGCGDALFGGGGLPESFEVLHDGIDLSEFAPDVGNVRGELGVGEHPLIGFVARLDPWKGLDVFLQAARCVADRFPDARFVVAGDAPSGYESYARKMRNLAESLGLGAVVNFVGFRYGAKEMPRLMASLDVFAHTSTSPEPFGLVLIEAMAAGRPVVASRAGGPLEIVVDGETGLLTPPGDSVALASAICSLLADRDGARAMGLAGRRRAEDKFSSGGFARSLGRLYQSVLEPRSVE